MTCLAPRPLALAALAAAGCGDGRGEANSRQATRLEQGAVVKPFPAEPDRMRAGDVPAKAGDFVIHPSTQFCGLGIVDPAVAKAIDPDDPGKFIETFPVRTQIDYRLLIERGHSVGAVGPIRASTRSSVFNTALASTMADWGTCPDDGRNILITHHLTLNRRGDPYAVILTARQGKFFWSASIERPEYVKPIQVVPRLYRFPEGKDWDPDRDAVELNRQLTQVIFPGR